MADITMCGGDGCPKKSECHRHTATPSQWQSMFLTSPALDMVDCFYFMSNANTVDDGDEEGFGL